MWEIIGNANWITRSKPSGGISIKKKHAFSSDLGCWGFTKMLLWVIHTKYKNIILIVCFSLVNYVLLFSSLIGIDGVGWSSSKVLSCSSSLFFVGKLFHLVISW